MLGGWLQGATSKGKQPDKVKLLVRRFFKPGNAFLGCLLAGVLVG